MPGWMKVYISLLLYLFHEKELIFEPQSRKTQFLYSILTNQEALRKKNDEYNKTNHIFFMKEAACAQWQNPH